MRRILLLSALSALACSAASDPAAARANDGGFTLNLPDAAQDCTAASRLGDAGQTDSGPCVPSEPRNFGTDILPLFAACSGEVCHNFTTGNLAAGIGAPALECCAGTTLIAPGNPEQSYLLDKLRGQRLCAGVQMPVDKPPLSDAEIQAISDWICEGAPTGS